MQNLLILVDKLNFARNIIFGCKLQISSQFFMSLLFPCWAHIVYYGFWHGIAFQIANVHVQLFSSSNASEQWDETDNSATLRSRILHRS